MSSKYNEDELVPPVWINQEFLEKVLKQFTNNDRAKLIQIDLKPACLKGDHYASVMFRCHLKYTTLDAVGILETCSWIIKTLPELEGLKREMLLESKLFETEIEMYTKTVPEFEKILEENGQPTKFSAKLIYSSIEPQKVIVFEDLCPLGYDTVRYRYLTEQEVKLTFLKIAKWHAVSYMLAHSKESADCVTRHKEGLFSVSTGLTKELLSGGIQYFLELLQSHEEFLPYYEKAKVMVPQMQAKCKALYREGEAETCKEAPCDIYVLNHGDFHLKNLMFKFNNQQQLEDLIFVDYQVSVYAPSIIDMIYSQYLILSPELRLRKHELMQYYFIHFEDTLKSLRFQGEIPKYSDLEKSFFKHRHFTLYQAATGLPMMPVLTKPPGVLKESEIGKIMSSPDLMREMYCAPEYLADLRKLLPVLLDEGYLD